MKVYDGERYRKLTPTEYFRLMGFTDADVELLMNNGISKTQLYKMAGNSIPVKMLEHLFKEIYPKKGMDALKQRALELLGQERNLHYEETQFTSLGGGVAYEKRPSEYPFDC